jgi:hypothetical protein
MRRRRRGGECFPRVDWVAVPKALRARRVNRREAEARRWYARAGAVAAAQQAGYESVVRRLPRGLLPPQTGRGQRALVLRDKGPR